MTHSEFTATTVVAYAFSLIIGTGIIGIFRDGQSLLEGIIILGFSMFVVFVAAHSVWLFKHK